MVGQTVSHYQILEKLGSGGMGEIYKALDPRLNRSVAVKVLPPGMSTDPARRRRFVQEAQAASGLNHPNIITIHDVVLEPEAAFIVMEYVTGKTLLDLIPNGGLRVPQALNYGVQIADALGAAHAAGIIHRDLKPGNVMVTDAGLVKVLDFGLAKFDSNAFSQPGDETETFIAGTLTVEGSILGTVNYMSPEQAQGFRVDARSDIFSFGVLLYEMLTGVRPFTGDSPISTMSAILRDEAKAVGELRTDVPKPLQDVILRCLRKKPEDRWQSMQEVRTSLAALKQETDSSMIAPRADAPKQLAAKAQGSKLNVPLVVLGIVVAGAAGVWFARRPAPTPGTNPVVVETSRPTAPPAASPPETPGTGKRSEADAVRTTTPQPPPVEPEKPVPHASSGVTIPDGSPIGVTLSEDIPANAVAGSPIHFTVTKDVEVGGIVAIRKGALVKGEIAQEGKKKFLGFGGKMMMRMMTVEAVDEHSLKVRATPGRRSDGQIARPVDLGRKVPKGVAAVAGTQYVGYIDGAQSVGSK